MTDGDWIGAEEARQLLGIRAQTLYAYASRGLLRARADPADARRSLYRRPEVEELALKKGRSRKLADVAAGAIAWGEPVLQSAITTVGDGRFYYRGHDAPELSTHATLETVATLLIGFGSKGARVAQRYPICRGPQSKDRLFKALALRTAQSPAAAGADISVLAEEAAVLLDLVVDAVAGANQEGQIHQRLALAWGKDPESPTSDLIRRILVLLADHELNASTFAARVTASTGASLAASLLSGLAALSGPRHGGMGSMVMQLVDEALISGPSATVARWIKEGQALPGFGHPLYPQGDIRAKILLDRIAVPACFAGIQREAFHLAGLTPNVDFALAAVSLACGLPRDAPFSVFATARSAGWLAHAIEQGLTGQLIRPRARYVGPT